MGGREGLAGLARSVAAAERRERLAKLRGRLRQWGTWQREGYALPGIDYGRPRTVGHAPTSALPAPDWYLDLCAQVAALPDQQRRALRLAYVVGDERYPHGAALDALLDLIGEEDTG